METVTYLSGATLTYDDTIAIGSLITVGRPGYYVLMEIQFRENMVPLFHCVKVLDTHGNPSTQKQSVHEAHYCQRFTRQDAEYVRDAAVQTANMRFNSVMQFL